MEDSSKRFAERSKNFHRSLDEEESSRRRQVLSIKLRRKQRNVNSAKKRASKTGDISLSGIEGEEILILHNLPTQLLALKSELSCDQFTDLEKLMMIKEIVFNNPSVENLMIILPTLRSMLTIDKGAPIGIFSNLGFGELFARCLNKSFGDIIMVESAWALCNMLAGPHEYIEKLLKLDIVNALTDAIVFGNNSVKEHCV